MVYTYVTYLLVTTNILLHFICFQLVSYLFWTSVVAVTASDLFEIPAYFGLLQD